jgi:phosphatidylinositol glycan class O
MQRIKALMSGTLPTFIDASSNFNSYVIEDDTIIRQLAKNNKSVIFTGDDTWVSLFPLEYFEKTYEYPSFNVKDIDTVDRNVNKILMPILNTKSTKWDFIIAHYLGVDHVGHTYGAKHPIMKRKLKEMDEIIL